MSILPRDFGSVGSVNRDKLSPVEMLQVNVGQFTANTTVTSLIGGADDAMVIRQVHLAADAVPADADGVMTVTVKVRDVSEGAFDTIVNAEDLETLIVAANKLYPATLAAETAENERTLEPGDTLLVDLISNSAAIDTNANVLVVILFQRLRALS